MKTPWYKRVAIWFTLAGAMVVGAFLLFGKWIRWNLFREPYDPVSPEREVVDQKIEDEVNDINRQIEAMENEPKPIHHDRTIIGVNADLAEDRELRRAKREYLARSGDRRTNRGDDRKN